MCKKRWDVHALVMDISSFFLGPRDLAIQMLEVLFLGRKLKTDYGNQSDMLFLPGSE